MKTNTNSRYAVAVLIDGDNASFEKMEDIMGFVSRYGDAVVRRVYGDWDEESAFRVEGNCPGAWIQARTGFLPCSRKEHDGYCAGHRRDGHSS